MKYISDRYRFNTYYMAIAALLFMNPGCAMDADQKMNWKTECVGYYQFDLPGAVEAALVKPREFAWDMPNSKLQIKTPENFSYILTDTPIWIGANVPREVMPHTDWRIVILDDNSSYSESEILARGKSDATGRISPNKEEEARIQAAYKLTPWRLWLTYKREAIQLLCKNNPPQENENQAELQEYCQPLKKANPLRFADGSQPRYSVRGTQAYYPRLKTLAGGNEGVYQVMPPDSQEVFEWLSKHSVWAAPIPVPANTLVNVDKESVLIYALRAGRIYRYHNSSNYATRWGDPNAAKKSPSSATSNATHFLNNFRVRGLFEVPKEPGVCIPHGFIADDGKIQRQMSVVFRLKNHPEVEIFFMEGQVSGQAGSAEEEIKEFLDSLYETRTSMGTISTVTDMSGDKLRIKEIETIQIAGRNGKALFKKMFDHGESQAYAYITYAKGNPLAAREMPELMFYLISGDEPAAANRLSKKEVLAMAQRIVASIKRRVPDEGL